MARTRAMFSVVIATLANELFYLSKSGLDLYHNSDNFISRCDKHRIAAYFDTNRRRRAFRLRILCMILG